MQPNPSAPDDTTALNDLGPLAWVLDELRKSLDGATKAVRRFVRDAEMARGSELTELDTSHLRIARTQLHQAVGALEMVGMQAPAKMLHAMEALAQRFVQRPESCSDEAANTVERASFALTEYLEGVLKGKQASAVALFPQYRAVMAQAGAERIHPSDLWPTEWRWLAVEPAPEIAPLPYAADTRVRLDHAVLQIVKTGDVKASRRMVGYCAGLSAAQTPGNERSFWAMAAGYFEALALALLPLDLYTKRTASRILQQYAALAKGGQTPSEQLAQELVFFCAMAQAPLGKPASALAAVRHAYGLDNFKTVDYETEQFGRFDPAQLVLVRKRIASAAETWSALAGGEVNRLKSVGEQFAAVTESVVKLHPESSSLAQALTAAIDAVLKSAAAPNPAIAMEVATSILYLEAAYEDLDPTDNHMAERGGRLALRLQHVCAGAEPEPLETWMEELYRRVSDRQTMGSVVDELRASLADVEKSLDQFFRKPDDKGALRDVPPRLAQMRGVFSVLGLDQPSLAALRMRASVEQLMMDEIDVEAARTGIFEKLGNSLGAMGFLIDMLSYQRALAKKLFVYDEVLGEFKPLMGRERSAVEAPSAPAPAATANAASVDASFIKTQSFEVPTASSVADTSHVKTQAFEMPATPAPASTATAVQPDEDDDADLQDIFLEEARDVVRNGLAAARELAIDPSNLAEQTTLRRAFHTLKGSSRMVGLHDFGEAAWSFEQLLNAWLAEQKPASDALITLASTAMQSLGAWVNDIADKTPTEWNAQDFRKSSDAMRLDGLFVPLHLHARKPVAPAVASPTPSPREPQFASTEFASTSMISSLNAESPAPQADFASTSLIGSLDFGVATAHQEFENTRNSKLEDTLSYQPSVSALQDLDPSDFKFEKIEPYAQESQGYEDDDASPVITDEQRESALLALDELDKIDAHEAMDSVLVPEPEPEPLPQPLIELDFPPKAQPQPVEELPAPQAEAPALAEAVAQAAEPDEQVKVIGNLRLSIPFYNVYLNEADEWSRRLQTELSEWALELHRPIPDSAVTLSHSLLGSSATVGFHALSTVARALESALSHVQLHEQGTAEHAAVFNNAAEEIRRLLHQFAAGFLKDCDAKIIQDLQDIIDTEFRTPADALDIDSQSDMETLMPDLEPVQSEDLSVFGAEEAPQTSSAPLMAAAPLKVAQSAEEELDAQDSLDPDLFPIFQEEALELMPSLGGALRQWVARPDNMGARGETLRVLHTLKGSARLAGAMRLGEMAHRLESSIEELGTEGLQSVQLEPLLNRFDGLQAALDALGKQEPAAGVEVAHAAHDTEEADAAPVAAPAAVAAPSVVDAATSTVIKMAASSAVVAPPIRTLAGQSVRVRSQLLDRLVNQAGEVMMSRSRLDSRLTQLRGSMGELTGNLDRLRLQLRDVELQAESQMQTRLAQSKDTAQGFDPLEFDRFTRVQELTRMMAESVNDVATVQRNIQRSVEGAEDDLIAQGRQARELQRDLLRTRMVEFEGISDRLYGVVRQAAKEAGKQVKLDIVGGSIEMDRGVLDRMTSAFEHILRNAVAHGIEATEVRLAAGKPAAGTITINVNQESNDVSVAFSDDGGGLHMERIRAKALAKQLIGPDEEMTDALAANLLFSPGFSTAEQVTELSGRGIGMDVVLSEVNALGGRIETSTVRGQGTRFQLVLPLTTAVTQVVMLRMGELNIGVPSNLMETVLRSPEAALEAAYQSGSYDFAGEHVPFYWGGALLHVSGRSVEEQTKHYPVAIFRSAGQRLALHVDEVLGNREVVVKNLGPQLARLPGLAGMSVLASGAVVLIYNPVALATVYGAQARTLQAATGSSGADESAGTSATSLGTSAGAPAAVTQLPLVLVVDDSITVRRVTQRLLKREGFRVVTANDGLDALEKLAQEKPDVVLSDIEMPRMDGFDLARNIRADANLADLPIIMITSRIAEKHREHAMALGVNNYLGKPYSEDVLLGLIREYCAVTAEA
jgi:chemosensory pili system protein ChpA (sensor histidine kinase/response regulator)